MQFVLDESTKRKGKFYTVKIFLTNQGHNTFKKKQELVTREKVLAFNSFNLLLNVKLFPAQHTLEDNYHE